MNNKDAIIMDKILQLQYDHATDYQNYDEFFQGLLTELNIDEDRFQYYVNKICDFSNYTETICHTYNQWNDGDYPMFDCDKNTKKFIEDGGFCKYYGIEPFIKNTPPIDNSRRIKTADDINFDMNYE